MIKLHSIHHIAIICSDYHQSKEFYTKVLGLDILREVYRTDKSSYKLDLALNGQYIIELFSFPSPPLRSSWPEATGLRHLAFEVQDIASAIELLREKDIAAELLRIDAYTGKRFTFIHDPDNLPIELYEI